MNSRDAPLQTQSIPSSDRAFAGVVEQAARSATTPDELEERLRALYPNVRLSERVLSEEPKVYYVYRDGAVLRDEADEWWTDRAAPYVEISTADGRIKNANGSWAELMGAPPAELLDRHYSEFLLPEAQATADALFASIMALSEVRSRLLLRRPDGRVITVEFRAVCDQDICRVHYRPV
jgi:PAS domain-containing protein